MNETNISPLARRLAEENNVDWRSLNGSGTDGKVVERDVLEYLARVMAGEEDTNPTPEPLPEGIESWPEDDIANFKREMANAGRNVDLEDLQSRLSAADRSPATRTGDFAGMAAEEPASFAFEDGDDLLEVDDLDDDALAGAPEVLRNEPMVAVHVSESARPDDISEDIFLFEDGSEEGLDDDGAFRGGSYAESISSDSFSDDAFSDESISDESFGSESFGSESFSSESFSDDSVSDGSGSDESMEEASFTDATIADAPPLAEHGGAFEQSAYDVDEVDDPYAAESIVAADADESVDDIFVDLEDDEGSAEGLADPFFDDRAPDAAKDVDPFGADFGAPGDDLGFGDEGDAAAVERAEAPIEAGAVPHPFGAGETVEPDTGDTGVQDDADARGSVDPVEDDAATATHEVIEPTPETDDGAHHVPAAAAYEVEEIEEVAHDGGAIGAETTTVVPGMPVPLPLVSYGTLLRRHLDLTSLAEAQFAVGRELGEEEPIAPTAFLMRAAAKALASVPLAGGNGGLGLVTLHEQGLGLRRLKGNADGAFLALVEEVRGGETGDAGDVALAVADMSAYEVDEAVLDLGMPLLTLGRVMYDSNEARYHSTLTMSGEISPDMGARFLARVGDLLATPIRLVL